MQRNEFFQLITNIDSKIANQERLTRVFEQNEDLADYFLSKTSQEALVELQRLDNQLKEREPNRAEKVFGFSCNNLLKLVLSGAFATSAYLYHYEKENGNGVLETVFAATTLVTACGLAAICICPRTAENPLKPILRVKYDTQLIRTELDIPQPREKCSIWLQKSIADCKQNADSKDSLAEPLNP